MHHKGFLATVCFGLTGLDLIAATAIPVPEAVEVLVPRHERRQNPNNPNPPLDPNTTNTTDTTGGARPGIPAAQTNCSDISTARKNECFAQLGISSYVREWISTHECYREEGFGNCYLRVNGFPALDCQSINANSCSPPTGAIDMDATIYYTIYNIYALNNFFKTWYEAIFAASETSEDKIGSIVALLDSPSTATTLNNDLASSLSSVTAQIRSNINQTALSVLSNYTEFLAFAEQGNFSEGTVSLPDASNYATFALNTFVASSALVKSNIFLTISRGTDVVKLATNGTQLAYPLPECAGGLNTQNLCDTWYYSKNYDASFGLVSRSSPQTNYAKITNALFDDLTTGELLFESALACGGGGEGEGGRPSTGPSAVANVTLTVSGVNTACISVLDAYDWDKQCLPAGNGGADCELVDLKGKKVPALKGFFDEGKGGARSVPPSYLGPAIAQTQVKISRE